MKKNLILLAALFVALLAVKAAPITSKQAEKNLKTFLYGNSKMKFSNGPIKMVTPDDGIQPYYIYNIGDDQGFVILSGDDAAYPVLGYSHKGHFDINNVPENMQQWLEVYAKDITSIQKLNLPARRETMTRGGDNRADVEMLVKSQWNQMEPYNDQCPDYHDGHGRRPTGCVATAMAQVMYYYKWPQEEISGIEAYSYEDSPEFGGDGSVRKVAALQPTVFDWVNMKDTYNANSSDKSKAAVAELMKYVGHSVKMMYGAQASGAFSENIPGALKDIFGYKSTAKIIYRQNYDSQDTWDDIMYRELSEKRPILYSGVSEEGGGHQFVCDGYENGFFHINWGWGGMSDGMFKLSALDPYNQGTGGAGTGSSFSLYQSAVIGIRKPGDGDNISARSLKIQCESEARLRVEMKNAREDYTSLEFDMVFPDGVSVVTDDAGSYKAAFVQKRSENGDHTVSVENRNGVYHFSVSSPTKSRIIKKKGEFLNITLWASAAIADGEYVGEINNIKAVSTDNAVVDFEDEGFKLKIEGNTGIDNTFADDYKETIVYTLEGLRINTPVDSLKKGIYIVNGKKIVIR